MLDDKTKVVCLGSFFLKKEWSPTREGGVDDEDDRKEKHVEGRRKVRMCRKDDAKQNSSRRCSS